MATVMIYCAGPMRNLEDGLVPAFVRAGEIQLGDFLPRQHTNGDDVIVYTQRSHKLWAYLGVLRRVILDEPGRRLRFDSYDAFPSPIVAADEDHGIDRPELRAPHKGWGRHDFNYIDWDAAKAILQARDMPVEALLWKAVSGCPSVAESTGRSSG